MPQSKLLINRECLCRLDRTLRPSRKQTSLYEIYCAKCPQHTKKDYVKFRLMYKI